MASASNDAGGDNNDHELTMTTTTTRNATTTTAAAVEQMQQRARHHASVALKTHQLLFGGGVHRFKRRMGPDLRLPIRPTAAGAESDMADGAVGGLGISPVDILWPDDEHDESSNTIF